ncbi:diguanylate cyclase [Thalassospira sp. GB04J01]|uniref:sensor domain-containing diguanylate cyclase n=1 Tax=Thalassospira sp. GB04J01 TaxID=1485225 RepID=UPI000C9CC75F|nr:diguanylate cyclase [Thalassospira sp. GB04J01]
MRLKHVLVICFLVLSVLPLFVSFGMLQSYSATQYRNQIGDKLNAVSQLAKQRLTAAIARIEDNTTLLANRTLLRQQMGEYAQTREYALYDTIENSLHEAKQGMEQIVDIGVFAPNGQFIASINRTATSFDRSMLKGRDRIIFLRHSQELIVRSIVEIDLKGRTVGYMVVDFSGQFILDLVNDHTGLGETGEWLFAVRDENGDALFAVPLKYDARAAFVRRVAKDRLDVPITQALRGQEIIMANAPDYQERPVMASTRYIKNMDIGLVAKINESEVTAIIDEANKYLVMLGIALVLIAVVVGVLIASLIAKPVEQLRKATQKLASGDFDVQPVEAGWREAKDLAASFTDMAESIHDLQENLQHKVEERTRDLDEANQRLTEISVRDPLTGVHNRRYVMERLEQEASRARRYNGQLAVAILDIDHFKQVNDTLGHATGDEVLIGLAFCVEHTLRTSDLFGRIGGEEFCIVIPEADKEGTMLLIERIRSAIEALPFNFDGKQLKVTCSFGVVFLAEEIDSTMLLMECADKALYHAKETGRNKIVVYNDMPKDLLSETSKDNAG